MKNLIVLFSVAFAPALAITLIVAIALIGLTALKELSPVPPAKQVVPTTYSAQALAARLNNYFAVVQSKAGLGSGVIVRRTDPAGHVIVLVWTCSHCVLSSEDAGDPTNAPLPVTVIINNHTYTTTLLGYGGLGPHETDVALLRVENAPLNTGSADFDTNAPVAGMAIYILGAAGGMTHPPSFFEGCVSTPGRLVGGQLYDQLDCATYFGCSGCGVFDAQCRVRGLTESLMTSAICFDTPARDIARWAKQKNLLWAMFESSPTH